jgi:hypothetical protein
MLQTGILLFVFSAIEGFVIPILPRISPGIASTQLKCFAGCNVAWIGIVVAKAQTWN